MAADKIRVFFLTPLNNFLQGTFFNSLRAYKGTFFNPLRGKNAVIRGLFSIPLKIPTNGVVKRYKALLGAVLIRVLFLAPTYSRYTIPGFKVYRMKGTEKAINNAVCVPLPCLPLSTYSGQREGEKMRIYHEERRKLHVKG